MGIDLYAKIRNVQEDSMISPSREEDGTAYEYIGRITSYVRQRLLAEGLIKPTHDGYFPGSCDEEWDEALDQYGDRIAALILQGEFSLKDQVDYYYVA